MQLAVELIHLGFEAYLTKYDCGEALVQLIQHTENLMTFTRVLDKARCAYRGGEPGNPAKLNCCLYHEHEETKRCDGSKTQLTGDATA
jgi:hypothetical protein